MTDRTQIGPSIDAALWHEFRENVRARKGQVRGVLGDELENAIRQYLHDDTDPNVARVERKVDRIAENLGVGLADGGADTREPATHTRATTSPTVTEKPAATASTEKKIAWLAGRVLDAESTTRDDLQSLSLDAIRTVVKDEYGFRADTAKRYVEELIDHFGLVEHPFADGIYVTPENREESIEKKREMEREKAEEKFKMTNSEHNTEDSDA